MTESVTTTTTLLHHHHGKQSADLPIYTREEVARHTTKDDAWVIIENHVYDVTCWLDKHPGGVTLILGLAGNDCTVEFKTFHLKPNYKRIKMFLIGRLPVHEYTGLTGLGKDLQQLHEDLKKEKSFETDLRQYIKLGAIIVALFAAFTFFLHLSSSYLSIAAGAICLGLFWQQLAFIGHDLGHHVVTHDRVKDERLGLVLGNFLQGISVAWWRHNHNTHHTLTNSVNHDPDIQHLPVLAVSKLFFDNIFSTYYNRVMSYDRVARWFVSVQHYMFFPIMGLARFNLYAQSYIFILTGAGSKSKTRNYELAALLGFLTWFTSVLVYTAHMYSVTHAVILLFVSHFTAGLVHIQICISHFAMQTFVGVPQAQYPDDGYFLSQLETTMNVQCAPWMDFFHGGLQFQIEHHVYPHLTRSRLRYVQTRLQELCAKHGLPHHSMSFVDAVCKVLSHLKATSNELRVSEMIWDGINMVG